MSYKIYYLVSQDILNERFPRLIAKIPNEEEEEEEERKSLVVEPNPEKSPFKRKVEALLNERQLRKLIFKCDHQYE